MQKTIGHQIENRKCVSRFFCHPQNDVLAQNSRGENIASMYRSICLPSWDRQLSKESFIITEGLGSEESHFSPEYAEKILNKMRHEFNW